MIKKKKPAPKKAVKKAAPKKSALKATPKEPGSDKWSDLGYYNTDPC